MIQNNMSELKFRIWDKQNKNWITENNQSLHCFSNWSICPFTGKLTDYVGAIDDDHGETYTANHAPDYYFTASGVVKEPRYIVVQYTGLKDSKGIEIYEGDIVKVKITDEVIPTNNGRKINASVRWDNFHGRWIVEGVIKEGLLDGEQYPFGADDNCFIDHHDLDRVEAKIIGNIFENLELLKQ